MQFTAKTPSCSVSGFPTNCGDGKWATGVLRDFPNLPPKKKGRPACKETSGPPRMRPGEVEPGREENFQGATDIATALFGPSPAAPKARTRR